MRRALLAACIALGCNGSSAPSGDSETSGTGTTTATSGGTSVDTTQPPDACVSSRDCVDEGGFCVAPYDAGGEGKGPSACVPECVGENDVQRWCVDDDSCCEGLQCKVVDGFCEAPDFPGTGTSTGSDTGTSTSTGSTG